MDYKKPWIKNLTYENLPNDDLKSLADIIGMELTIKVIFELAGIHISVPKNSGMLAKSAYVREHYDGTKKMRMKLAKDCDVSESYIYKIVKNRY